MLALSMLCYVVLMLVLLCPVSFAVVNEKTEHQTCMSQCKAIQTGDRLDNGQTICTHCEECTVEYRSWMGQLPCCTTESSVVVTAAML